MTKGEWSDLTRALRAEKDERARLCNQTTGTAYESHHIARSVLEALELVAERMAGGNANV